MACLSREQLWAYVHDEEDDHASRAAVGEHLSGCSACSAAAEEMRTLIDDLRAASSDVPDEGSSQQLPERIGAYRIIGLLGRGGMGAVYEAEQAEPHRRVALKIISGRGGLDDYQARMFRREMQALARLNHPHIAAIHDAGIDQNGRPFFAMEHVEGQTLDTWLRGKPNLTFRERVALFHDICTAVAHAHQRGVIHRDLKPANVMITPERRPKVLDFGLARGVDETEAATLAIESGRLVGSLPYMSPEQASGDAAQIDVRSDVYSLGVMLYELLCGAPPYEVRGKSMSQALRVIIEQPLPDPRIRTRAVPHDLATIVLKAADKNPTRRYNSAAELADDLQRWIDNRPILARPAGRAYRFMKLVQRHKLASGLLTLIVLMAFASAGIFAGQARRIAQERDSARLSAQRAIVMNDFLIGMLSAIDPQTALGRDVTVREVVDQAARTVGEELQGQPALEAAVRDTIARVYNALTEHEAAALHATESLRLRRMLHPGDHEDVAASLVRIGEIDYMRGRFADAEEATRAALAMRERLSATDAKLAECAQNLGALAWMQGRFDEAEEWLRGAIELYSAEFSPESTEVARSRSTLGLLLRERGDFLAAENVIRAALDAQLRLHPEHHPDVAVAMNNLALLLRDTGRLDEAEALYHRAMEANRRVFGERHATIAANLSNLANVLLAREDMDGAAALFEQSIEMNRDLFGDRHAGLAIDLNNLGVLRFRQGKLDEAQQLLETALAVKRALYGEQHPEVAADLNNLGVIARRRNDLDSAERFLRQALEVNAAVYGREHSRVATNLNNLADILAARDDLDAAIELHREALAIRERILPPESPEISEEWATLADVLLRARRIDEAQDAAHRCLTLRREHLGPDHARTKSAEELVARVREAEQAARE